MAGVVGYVGRAGCVFLMGWTGGDVLLAQLIAPYFRKFGKYTVPDFVGDRYYWWVARVVAVICAIFISMMMTGIPIPQIGFGAELADGSGTYLLDRLDGLTDELGFGAYTDGRKGTLDMLFITAALLVWTVGPPHVVVRVYTVPQVRPARGSAGCHRGVPRSERGRLPGCRS